MITTPTIIVTIILVILTIALPRRYFLAPYIIAACFLPADQRVLILTLDFTCLRILVVTGALRIFLRGEHNTIQWNKFDKLLLGWAVCGAAVFIIQQSNTSALIYKCGVLFDIVGLYWLFRQNIRSWSDIKFIVKLFALCAILMTPLVALEWVTGRNPFLFFGRVHTVIREGSYRCQASFPHSIMLGLFWATLIPVFIGSSKERRWGKLYWAATAASVFIVFSTTSSTPIFTLACTMCLLPLFRYRRYGCQVAWALCGLTVALHMVMKAPVWHLISRINIIGGSTGYHRYKLIDETIEHFSEWALLGTDGTAHWGYHLFDITNQYCLEAVRGGLITLSLFVVLLIMAVRVIGRYSLCSIPRDKQWLTWGICVSILAHCVSFFGVSYFGQIRMLLYLTFAIVGTTYEKSYNPLPVGQLQNLPYGVT